ncbi:hypothetical protein ACP4OV_015484 [Aristida adscensionis]
MVLHWDKNQASEMLNTFDIIIASDWSHIFQAIPSEPCSGSQILVEAFSNLTGHLSEPQER